MTILQTIACGRTEMPQLPTPEPFVEAHYGRFTCREYPMVVAKVREIRRRDGKGQEVIGNE